MGCAWGNTVWACGDATTRNVLVWERGCQLFRNVYRYVNTAGGISFFDKSYNRTAPIFKETNQWSAIVSHPIRWYHPQPRQKWNEIFHFWSSFNILCKLLSRNPSYERPFIINIIPLVFVSVMHSACALLTVNALSGMQLQGELSSVAVIGQSESRSAFTSDHYVVPNNKR